MGHGKASRRLRFCEALVFWLVAAGRESSRLTGQDFERGTFNQRHAVLLTPKRKEYCSLAHLGAHQPFWRDSQSSLSKLAAWLLNMVLAVIIRKPWSLGKRKSAILPNGAQVIIDQFISAGEDKWDLPSAW